jgi:tetratricopeptide (TPR) repeat protein
MYEEQSLYDDAIAALKKGLKDLARQRFEDVVSLNPKHALAYANLGQLHCDEGRHHDAVVNYEKSIYCNPHPQYYNNIGTSLIERNRWEDAEAGYREAIRLDPKLAIAHNNLGRLLLVRGRPQEAKIELRKAIELSPDYPEPHIALGFAHLELGEFEQGWAEYEWRRKQIPQNRPMPPDFTGQELSHDDAVVIIGEQGLGDSLQFCRYAPLVKQKYGCRVYVEVKPALTRLMNTLQGIDGVIAYGDDFPPDAKYSIWMVSCPMLFGHYNEKDFPRYKSYLSATKQRVEFFSQFVNYFPPGPRVGICWAGGGDIPGVDKRRSTHLDMWKPLGAIEGITWVNLQKGGASDQIRTARTGMTMLNLIEKECNDMADTAALVIHCDLVITVDTAIAHLAAALGKPTWVLSRRDACWRWLLDRRDNPWYPSVRHYRQKTFNDWPGLMNEVAVDLKKWVEQRKADNNVVKFAPSNWPVHQQQLKEAA